MYLKAIDWKAIWKFCVAVIFVDYALIENQEYTRNVGWKLLWSVVPKKLIENKQLFKIRNFSSPSLPRNGALGTCELPIVFSTKVNLLYLLYSTSQRCYLLHLIKENCLLKVFLRTLIMMTLFTCFSLLELIWNCITFL